MTGPELPSGRGGRRPGAGAPRGNLNALKHGGRSHQFARIGALLAQSPKVRETLLALAERHQMQQRTADEVAAELLARILYRANELAGHRLLDDRSLLALDALAEDLELDGHTINRNTRPQSRRRRKITTFTTDNQTPDSNSDTQSKSR